MEWTSPGGNPMQNTVNCAKHQRKWPHSNPEWRNTMSHFSPRFGASWPKKKRKFTHCVCHSHLSSLIVSPNLENSFVEWLDRCMQKGSIGVRKTAPRHSPEGRSSKNPYTVGPGPQAAEGAGFATSPAPEYWGLWAPPLTMLALHVRVGLLLLKGGPTLRLHGPMLGSLLVAHRFVVKEVVASISPRGPLRRYRLLPGLPSQRGHPPVPRRPPGQPICKATRPEMKLEALKALKHVRRTKGCWCSSSRNQ